MESCFFALIFWVWRESRIWDDWRTNSINDGFKKGSNSIKFKSTRSHSKEVKLSMTFEKNTCTLVCKHVYGCLRIVTLCSRFNSRDSSITNPMFSKWGPFVLCLWGLKFGINVFTFKTEFIARSNSIIRIFGRM